MQKIALHTGVLTSGHKVRGVGFYTRKLLETLGGSVEAVDLNSVDKEKYDVLHYPFFNPFFYSFDFKYAPKTVITIHDLIPLIYPKHYPPGIRGKIRFWIQKARLGKIGAIITDTEASKKDIVRFLGIPGEKIHVVHLAPANPVGKIKDKKILSRIKAKYSLPNKFVLYVGDVNYNKNIHVLVHAARELNISLVIIGKQAGEIAHGGMIMLNDLKGPMDILRFLFGRPHPENAHFAKMAHHFSRKENKIVCLGFVSGRDIAALYNLASAYCQPSLYEGFGLPVLEAQSCGTPVVASRTQALVEVAGNGATFFDPKDKKDLVEKLNKILKDKEFAAKLVKRGKENVKKFSWAKTAEKTLRAYRLI